MKRGGGGKGEQKDRLQGGGGGGVFKIMHRRTNQVRQFTEHCLLVTDVHL